MISIASGIEHEDPLDNLPTMGRSSRQPEPVDESLGSLRTIVRSGDSSFTESGVAGESLESRYELLEEIGRGGFAKVWKARDKKLGHNVAVKRLLAEQLQGPGGEIALARFRREAQAIAQLKHRNIVEVYDVGRDEDGDYLVIELVEGGSLRDLLRQKGLVPLDQTIALIKGIAKGLAYAHKKNLVHRDIKPANILLADDGGELVPKIVDFGLARSGSESELSMTGYGMGTPYYMPPEQRRDAKSVNHTADIYALGKTFYEMLTEEVPDQVDPEKIPPHLAPLILRCVKNNPADRYFSAEEFLADLEGGSGRKSHIFNAKQAENANQCPSCGIENPPKAEYCGSCGAGLIRDCPECDQKNSVHRAFCVACGTGIEGFLKWAEAASRMEKFTAERQWSRVEKEYGLLPQDVRMPRNKGIGLRKKVESLHKKAAQSLEQIALLQKDTASAENSKDWPALEKALQSYIELQPEDEKLTARYREVAHLAELESGERALRGAGEAEQSKSHDLAWDICASYLASYPKGRHAAEIRQRQVGIKVAWINEWRRLIDDLVHSGDPKVAKDYGAKLIAGCGESDELNGLMQKIKEIEWSRREAAAWKSAGEEAAACARKQDTAGVLKAWLSYQQLSSEGPLQHKVELSERLRKAKDAWLQEWTKRFEGHVVQGRESMAIEMGSELKLMLPNDEEAGRMASDVKGLVEKTKERWKNRVRNPVGIAFTVGYALYITFVVWQSEIRKNSGSGGLCILVTMVLPFIIYKLSRSIIYALIPGVILVITAAVFSPGISDTILGFFLFLLPVIVFRAFKGKS